MNKSLLFLPDISGFTEFVQNTEVSHSQHVISELLQVLVDANTLDLELAEIEGDALFFFKSEIPSLEKLLAQVETMFTAFYSHLKLLERNRICPCNACSTAPNLELKIIAHSGEIEFITVQDKRKPFGNQVIEVHRLMKNSVNSDSYVLLSQSLAHDIELQKQYKSKIFSFQESENEYDNKTIHYLFSEVDKGNLNLKPFAQAKKVEFDKPPSIRLKKAFNISSESLIELITNYSNRHHWVEGVDKFEYNENEVTRIGSPHVCVIDGKRLDFITVIKKGEPGQIIYGELTTTPPPVDELYQFYIITPLTNNSCNLKLEVYIKAKSPLKKLMIALVVKKGFRKNALKALDNLHKFAHSSTKL